MMNCYYLSFLIDEIWLDLQDKSAFGPSGFDLHYGLARKRLEC